MSYTMRWGVVMGWVHVRGHWLNLGTAVFIREVREPGQHIKVVQIGVNAPDPAGPSAKNDGTGLISVLYFGEDARKILRHMRL